MQSNKAMSSKICMLDKTSDKQKFLFLISNENELKVLESYF